MATNNLQLANNMAAASAIMLQAGMAITNSDSLKRSEEPQDVANDNEVYNLSSGLFPCVCVAMYGTILGQDSFEESLNDGEAEFYYNTIDSEDYRKALIEAAQDYIDDTIIELLKDYGLLKIEADHIWSPKYYNYNNDELIMDVTMVHDWKNIMAQNVAAWKDNEVINNYIRKNWRSYDGYINLMPESLAEVLTEEDEERQLAAYLTLALIAEGYNQTCEWVIDDLYERMSEKYVEYNRINVIEEYYDDEDEANKLLRLWNDDTEWNELYWALRDKIGSPWRYDNQFSSLDGKKDSSFSWQADSEGKRMLFWAVKQELTVEDLYSMAA